MDYSFSFDTNTKMEFRKNVNLGKIVRSTNEKKLYFSILGRGLYFFLNMHMYISVLFFTETKTIKITFWKILFGEIRKG